MEILGRRSKNNPVLVGAAGVGKTAIVEGLADAIIKEQVPEVLRGKTLYSLDLGALMAGTKYRGEFEERLQGLLIFMKEKNGQVLLFIDEIHQLVGAGKTDGAMDAANLLKPALARGELHCIGATTEDEFQKYILGDSALERRFRQVPVRDPGPHDAVEILLGLREKLEAHHGVKISDEAIYSSVSLSEQYITNKYLPDKAIDLLDEAASALKLSGQAMPRELAEKEDEIRSLKIQAQMEQEEGLKKKIDALEKQFILEKEQWFKDVAKIKETGDLTNQLDRYKFELDEAQRSADFEKASQLKYSLIPEIQAKIESLGSLYCLGKENIAEVIVRQTGIPLNKILMDKQEKVLELEGQLKGRVYGQDFAIETISDTLITAYAGLKDQSRPLGSFLLKGPSGVGKTETAKAVGQFLLESEKKMIRLDMSEYSEKHSVAKLIGAPAGYVGYDEGGILTEAVRRQPYSVILLDEIEKAHPDFSHILLQILDDGRLTDNKGRTIDFKNTILFMTTNSQNLETDFPPEVLGRIDAVCTYESLSDPIIEQLIERELDLLNQRLRPKKTSVELSKDLKEKLKNVGLDPRYGARPLKGEFNRLIVRPLGKRVVLGESLPEQMNLDWKGRKLSIEG